MPNVESLPLLPDALASWTREILDIQEALYALASHLDGDELPMAMFERSGHPRPEHETTVAAAIAGHVAKLRKAPRPTDSDTYHALAVDLIEPADQLHAISATLQGIAKRFQRMEASP